MNTLQVIEHELTVLMESTGYTESLSDPHGAAVWIGPRVNKALDAARAELTRLAFGGSETR